MMMIFVKKTQSNVVKTGRNVQGFLGGGMGWDWKIIVEPAVQTAGRRAFPPFSNLYHAHLLG